MTEEESKMIAEIKATLVEVQAVVDRQKELYQSTLDMCEYRRKKIEDLQADLERWKAHAMACPEQVCLSNECFWAKCGECIDKRCIHFCHFRTEHE